MRSKLARAAVAILFGAGLFAAVPNPVVIGPIPATVQPGDAFHNYPFFSTSVDLASLGYVEQEFFFEGAANTYNIDPQVPSKQTAIITSSGNSYRTRIIVRRPLSAEDFNGTVVMEWQNVTGGYEPDALWIESHDHFIRRGYAWIGVSAQRRGVYAPVVGLQAWSPNRYSTLNIPNTGSIMTDTDGLSWDIFSQAAQAVRHPQSIDPMGGLHVERVFAVGWSQSATRLAIYYNSIHALTRVFDGFGLIGLDGQVLVPLRTDQDVLDVKVFKVQPETNIAGNGQGISQALLRDKEPNTDFFRRWEVAGAAQLGYYEVQEMAPLQARDLPPSPPLTCVLPPFSRIPFRFVVNAAYNHMVDWVKHNVEPPVGADIEVATLGPQSVLARDSFGNVLGGIRLSQHAVATATNTGLNNPVTTICRYVGSYMPFPQALLDVLYPDHQTYISLVIAATHENQKLGFIVGADAAATIREAADDEIGRK
jgi:alpha/beta hydrolase family protein